MEVGDSLIQKGFDIKDDCGIVDADQNIPPLHCFTV